MRGFIPRKATRETAGTRVGKVDSSSSWAQTLSLPVAAQGVNGEEQHTNMMWNQAPLLSTFPLLISVF